MSKYNTGYLNTGNRNTGNYNTGNRNTGDLNTRNCNTGNCNTGDWNTGYRNTGDWNTGDYNTGYFNTITPNEILVFNKKCSKEEWDSFEKPDFLYFDLTEWIYDDNMTRKEKKENPTYKTTGGYLKKYEYKEAFRESYYSLSEEERKRQTEQLKALPNFNKEIFKEISGIDIDEYETNEEIKQLQQENKQLKGELSKYQFMIAKFKDLKTQMTILNKKNLKYSSEEILNSFEEILKGDSNE